MSILILRIKDFGFDINKFLTKTLNVNQSYLNNFDLIEKKRFIYCDGFKRELKTLGESCVEIIANNFFLQKKWCQEKNLKFDKNKWYNDILKNQINYYNPKILYFEGNIYLDFNFLKRLKQKHKFKIVIRSGLPLNKNQKEVSDIILAATPCLNNLYNQENFNSFLIYHYFDKEILNEIRVKSFKEKKNTPVFVGSSGFNSSNKLTKRYFFLQKLVSNIEMDFFLFEGKKISLINLLKRKFIYLLKFSILFFSKYFDFLLKKYSFYENFRSKREIFMNNHLLNPNIKNFFFNPKKPLKEIFPTKINDSKFGIDLYQKISDHKMFINSHVDNIYSAGNLKMFESTGMKTALFVEKFDNLKDIFIEGEEIVSYSNFEDLKNKIKFYNNNQDELHSIAVKGHDRTIKYHSTQARIKDILEILKN